MAVRIASRVPGSAKSSGTKSNQNAKKASKSSKTASKNTKTTVPTAKKTSTSAKTAAKMAAKKAEKKARETAILAKKIGANSQRATAVSITTSAGIAIQSNPTAVQRQTTIPAGTGKRVGVSCLKDAPKIYTASGQASSYSSPGKSDTLPSSNPSDKMPVRTNIGVSSFTYGRPEESYTNQKKIKSTSAKKISLPLAVQKPVKTTKEKSKKKAGETKTKVKIHLPSASRSGSGKMVYSDKTNPTGAKEGASLISSLLPFVGDAKDVQETVTGKDLLTGNKLSKADRVITAGTIVLPVLSGKSVRAVKSGDKAVKKPAKKVVKATFKTAKKTTEKAVKNIEKKSGTVAKNLKDTGKVLADQLEETGKKINKTVKETVKIEMDPVNGVVKGKGGSKTGKVWDNIEATQDCYPNTNIPRSFEVDVNG